MTHLQKLLIADGAFVTPAHVLESLSAEQAKTRLNGAPHSLYEELWHTDFWQRLILSVVHGEPVAFPEHAAEGWSKKPKRLRKDRGKVSSAFRTDGLAAAIFGSLAPAVGWGHVVGI